MKYLKQFGLILLLYILAIGINKLFIPLIPSTVIGMLMLFLLLILKIIKLESIREFSDFMLLNLAFFFIPPGVTLIKTWDILKADFFKIFFVVISTTFITMINTGLVVDFLIRKKEEKHGDNK